MTDSPFEVPPTSRSGRPAMEVALETARLAGGIIRERFQTSKQVTFKGRADIVTDVDLQVEKAVLGVLREEYPQFGILAEESGRVESGSSYTWVVDPLDGTRNYANGIPHFSTVVGLVRDGEPVLGITYDPVRDETFTAELGKGSFLNGERFSVSENRRLDRSLLGCDLGYVDEKAGLAIDLIRALWPGMLSLRLMGSAALGVAYAAAGRVDLYFHHTLAPWDVVSGLLLVREAGGKIVDRQGRPAGLHTPSVIASNGFLVEEFLNKTEGLPWRRG